MICAVEYGVWDNEIEYVAIWHTYDILRSRRGRKLYKHDIIWYHHNSIML